MENITHSEMFFMLFQLINEHYPNIYAFKKYFGVQFDTGKSYIFGILMSFQSYVAISNF